MALLAGATLDEELVLGAGVGYFVMLLVLLLVSAIAKTAIVQVFLERIAASEREFSKCMLILSVSEVPGLVSLALFMTRFMV